MRFEISSAAAFLMNLLRMGNTLDEAQLDVFRGHLEELLKKHYQHHWFPEQPCKGSGYRCIRINHKMDPLVARAASAVGVSDSTILHNMFPNELTLWIDPREVSYRIGENGSICVLYEGAASNNNNTNHNTSSSSSSSPSSTSSSSTSPTTTNHRNNHHNTNGHNHHLQHHLQQQHQQQQQQRANNNHHHHHGGMGQSSPVGAAMAAAAGPLCPSAGALSRYSTCKEIVRGLDNISIMDARNINFEQFATFVSS